MQSSISDQDMMNEISAYVAASQRKKHKGEKKSTKSSESPYLVDQVKLLPAECFSANDSLQTQLRIQKKILRNALKKRKPSDPDEILNYYASQQNSERRIPKEIFEAKSLTLPFCDAMMKIDQFVELDKSTRSNELSFEKYNTSFISNKPLPKPPTSRIPSISKQKLVAADFHHSVSAVAGLAQATALVVDTPSAAQAPARNSRFHRKYPRLCKSFSFTDRDIDGVEQCSRSDYWMARFLEDCFDEAFTVCNTLVSKEEKWRLRNGLDLGSIECFPKVVERLLNTRYSVLEIRTQICLELLCGLERMVEISEGCRIADPPPSAQAVQQTGENVYDGERAQLFLKFLSEEYDLDFLAMFLRVRDVVQTAFRFRLRELNHARIWQDDQDEDILDRDIGMAEFTYYRVQQLSSSKTTATASGRSKRKHAWSAEALTLTAKMDSQISTKRKLSRTVASRAAEQQVRGIAGPTPSARRGRGTTAGDDEGAQSLHPTQEGKKVVPVTLPQSWHFLHDLTMPEAPLVGFDRGLISLMCVHLLPHTGQAVRTYLTDRVVAMTRDSIIDTVTAVRDLATDSSILDATGRVSVSTARESYAAGKIVRIIPLYVFFKTLCVEWKKLSLETKFSFIESGAGAESLKSLNNIYKDNNEMMRLLDEEIAEVQKNQGAAQSRVLRLEKNIRRLERRRLADSASIAELDSIKESKVQLNSDRLISSELESKETELLKRKGDLQRRIESLWRKATLNSLPISTDSHRKKFKAKLKQSIAFSTTEKRQRTAEEEIASRHSDWKVVVGSWLVKVIAANLEEDVALRRSAEQKLLKDRMDMEAKRIASEERGLAETEATEEQDARSAQNKRPVSRSGDIHTPGPTQQFFILEVLAKVVVRNVLRDGVRSVALREYLRRQEHKLLLLYGSNEYKRKDRERLLREKEKREQRERYLQRVRAARAMSGGIVGGTMQEARSRAEMALFDPWSLLDLHPSTWLSPVVLHRVEALYAAAKSAYILKCLQYLFHSLKREWGLVQLRKKHRRRIGKLVLRSLWRDMMASRHLHLCAHAVQRIIRSFLFRQRLQCFMKQQSTSLELAAQHDRSRAKQQSELCFHYWRKMCSLKHRFHSTIAALKDRRFILSFYIWRDQFKKHKYLRIVLTAEQLRACMLLQGAARCFIAWRRLKMLLAKKKLVGLARRFLARQRVQRERARCRRLRDYARRISITNSEHDARRNFFAWRCCKNMIAGVSHLDWAVKCDQMRRRFHKWVNLAQYRTKRLAVQARKIQSLVRMWLTHRYILHYYRWRRGLVTFQSLYRMRLCVRQYVYDIYFYRMAKRIQRLFRGYRCRIHLNDQRVIDIHYAASHNNYDRLKFYVDNFPELVPNLDSEGNTALHSAAKNACKRTLKLLVRHKFMDTNVRNVAGYTALHLTIMSVSPARDDCYFYMMERGFSDEEHGPDGKTTLLIAAEYGRTVITRHLLEEEDHNPNIADVNGTTALQTACWQGNVAMVKDLIDNEADVNMPGYNGTFPLHDCVYSGSVEIAQMLLNHGAYVNVYEPYSYQTPLMYASSAGMSDIARLYLIQGAEVNAKDIKGQTAAHHGVASNKADVYNALREADADFDGQDLDGNSPMHLAAEAGASDFAIAMLHGGAYPSWQNSQGDQPAHIAARYNQLDMLKQICRYDEHIGRVNFEHQTPLGVAKFHLATECQAFLAKHYRMVEVKDGRNKVGELWWDKEIDDLVGDWEVSVAASGERFYINRKTAEISMVPPALSASQVGQTAQKAELPLHRTVTIVKEENTLTKHAYYLDFAEKEKDVAEISKDFTNATVIVKYARRKLAYMELQRLQSQKRRTKVLTRFLKRHLPGFMLWRRVVYSRSATRIQAAYRSYRFRLVYYRWPEGEYFHRRLARAHWRLRYKLWALWKFYICRQEFKLIRLSKNQPQTLADWQVIIDQARRPVRRVGIYEDYLYPNTHNIHFYRHSLTGLCSFQKPKKMKIIDELVTLERSQIKKYGATVKQIELATKLQALWRGYQVRTYSKYVARAMKISLHAESNYLGNPDVDSNLYNYALHCFVGLQDLNRARRAFVESLRRMQWRGPDLPFVLYSYSIFALLAHDESYADVMLLLTRARQAEKELDVIKRTKLGGPAVSASAPAADGEFRFGKSFDLANTGFFRHMAICSHNSFGWEAFAICRFLVYRDFSSSFDAFMEAFRFAPEDKSLMENFNTMMIHFHGRSKTHRDEVVKARQQRLAQMDADLEELRRQRRVYAQLRSDSARAIQQWFKKCKENRIYAAFMDGVRSIIRRRRRTVSSQSARSLSSAKSGQRPQSQNNNSGLPSSQRGQRKSDGIHYSHQERTNSPQNNRLDTPSSTVRPSPISSPLSGQSSRRRL